MAVAVDVAPDVVPVADTLHVAPDVAAITHTLLERQVSLPHVLSWLLHVFTFPAN